MTNLDMFFIQIVGKYVLSRYITNYTNFLPLFQDLKLNHDTDVLWMIHQDQEVDIQHCTSNEIYPTRKNVFLIDSENVFFANHNWQTDSRVHVWTPTVSDQTNCWTYLFWFDWMQEIEQSLKFVDKIQKPNSKQFFFDALLGTPREHKNIVHNLIQNSEIKHLLMVSYNGNPNTDPNCEWIKAADEEIPGQMMLYNNVQQANPACVVPYRIYDQCWYSLVAETSADLPNFYTEKTGKPLLAKRLFVVFAAQHHLKHLRDFGFKTFDGIIDESYDDIADLETRYQQAWKQVEFLLTQDPLEIYKHAQSILEHNHTHFVSTNWQKEMHKKIQNISQSSK